MQKATASLDVAKEICLCRSSGSFFWTGRNFKLKNIKRRAKNSNHGFQDNMFPVNSQLALARV